VFAFRVKESPSPIPAEKQIQDNFTRKFILEAQCFVLRFLGPNVRFWPGTSCEIVETDSPLIPVVSKSNFVATK
jgi:hypothetical protein